MLGVRCNENESVHLSGKTKCSARGAENTEPLDSILKEICDYRMESYQLIFEGENEEERPSSVEPVERARGPPSWTSAGPLLWRPSIDGSSASVRLVTRPKGIGSGSQIHHILLHFILHRLRPTPSAARRIVVRRRGHQTVTGKRKQNKKRSGPLLFVSSFIFIDESSVVVSRRCRCCADVGVAARRRDDAGDALAEYGAVYSSPANVGAACRRHSIPQATLFHQNLT